MTKMSDERLKYSAELEAICPFCKAVHTAKAEAHLDFEDDDGYDDCGPSCSLWVVVTCENCEREIYRRETTDD